MWSAAGSGTGPAGRSGRPSAAVQVPLVAEQAAQVRR